MIHTVEQVSPKIALTAEGYLLCADVAIARTGTLIYAAGEIPAEPNAEGLIYVNRSADEVFKDEAINSFLAKPVTNLHPDSMVTPDNWKDVAVGTVQNVRREDGFLMADLLITDAAAINDIQKNGLREVSCGYDAQYIQTSPGYASQAGIIGNHVALVPRGRCGTSCSIKDHEIMKKLSFKDKMLAAFKTRDEGEINKVLDEIGEGEGGDLHIHLPSESKQEETKDDEDPMEARLQAIESALTALTKTGDDAPVDEEDKENATEDDDDDDSEKPTADAFKSVLSKAAILSPGIKFTAPTGDAKTAAFKDAICGCKLQALKSAYATDAGKSAIEPFLAGKTIDKLKGASLDAVFAGASALMGARNNAGTRVTSTKDFGHSPKTPAEINAANAAFWANRK